MDSLFDMTTSGEITISPEVLMFPEFEELWERDKTKDKKTAKKELCFIWGMISDSDKNIWKDFKDPLKRASIIKSDIFDKTSDWKPDTVVAKAMEKYKSRIPRTPLDDMIGSVEEVINKLSTYLKSVDFSERDVTGKIVHDPKKVRDIISSMGKTVADYNELKRQVAAGKVDSNEAIRGGGTKGYFEDSNSFTAFK